jgi:hypothetical protein
LGLLSVSSQDSVYFVKQREDLFYEVYFGNGVLGKAINSGNVVYLDYYASSGQAANNCGQFYYAGGYRGDALYQVTTLQLSAGGANAESIESVKYNAPRNYVAQNRAVTDKDYISQILQQFPFVESVSVWGGEDHYPPRYGSVYICAKPFDRNVCTADEKYEIVEFLKANRSMLSIQPIIVDPTYTNLVIKTGVYFNPDKTTKTADDLSVLIKNGILNYVNSLNSLKKSFRYSTLTKLIDSTDYSIVSNLTKVYVKQYVTIIVGTSETYSVRLNNPIDIKAGSVKSSRFYLPSSSNSFFLMNSLAGKLDLYEVLPSGVDQFIQ